MRNKEEGRIYIVIEDGGTVHRDIVPMGFFNAKIGMSTQIDENLNKRISGIQVGNPRKIKTYYISPFTKNYIIYEKILKSAFTSANRKIRGEWFLIEPFEMTALENILAEAPESDYIENKEEKLNWFEETYDELATMLTKTAKKIAA